MSNFQPLTFIRRFGPGAQWFVMVIFALLALGATASVMAATPPAGSVIGNQATATYTDFSGQTKTATSNLVETTVQQVGSFTLVQDNTKTAAIGNTVYMPHTLTNTGNGSDFFTLSVTDDLVFTDTFTATNIAIYLDANGDGVPDSTTPLATGLDSTFITPSLPAGGAYSFVVSMTVPAGATAGQTDKNNITATAGTPGLYTKTSDSNTDTLIVTAAAAFQVNKSISATQGPVGTTLTYTLTYKNTGAAAGTLALNDVIGSGATAGYTYLVDGYGLEGSGLGALWSAGATKLTNADDDDVTVGDMTILYKAVTSDSVTTIDATISNIGPNVTGTITFKVLVDADAVVGTTTTTNTAMYGVDTATLYTNPSAYDVLASYRVVLNDGTNDTGVPTDGTNARPASTDVDASNADLSYVTKASPGQTISFSNYVWNTGNTTDTFNVTATGMGTVTNYGTAWPAGTTFQLYKSDGATPLMDTNGDGIADTGTMDAGASYKVILKATLPAGACDGGCPNPTGPFDVEKIATSVGDPTKSNKTYDRLGSITAPTVDLANTSGSFDTEVNQDAIGDDPTTVKPVLPGQSTTFNLFIRNEGLIADTYSLAYSGTNAFDPTTTLPDGWTLQFMDGASEITSVGPLAAGAQKVITAVVTVPANALAGDTNIYFQVKSQVTGAFDTKWDAVTVTAVDALTLQPSNSGQVYPGGTVVYPHTLSNTGNTSCTTTVPNTFTFTIAESLAAQGWTFVLYKDVNGDGLLDAADTVLPGNVLTYADANNILDPGEQVKVLVKVFAPAGAAAGSTDVVTIFATNNCALQSSTATDTTTVVTGQVRLTKMQAIDTDCDGDISDETVKTFSPNQLSAKPGECIIYQVTATNEGLGDVTALKIEDTLPAFTAKAAGPSCTVPGTTTAAGSYSNTTFSCSGTTSPAITLQPAETAIMTFSVMVQQ